MTATPPTGTPTPFSEARVPRPPEPSTPPLALRGAATGAAVCLAAMFVYQLLHIGWLLAHDLTRGSGAGVDSADRVMGVLVLGSLLSLAPSVFAGLVLGAVTGAFLSVTWRRQGVLRAWLSGSLIGYVAALIVNATVLLHRRAEPLQFAHWLSLIGFPSILYVLLLGGIGAYLYVVGAADVRADPLIDDTGR